VAQGRADDALELLEKAVQVGFRWRGYLEGDPSFTDLHDNQRFRRILDDLSLRGERLKAEVASYDR